MKVIIKAPCCISIFFFNDEKPHQGKALWTHHWIANHGYTTPSAKTMYWAIQGKFLVEIEPRMSESTTHPKSSTN